MDELQHSEAQIQSGEGTEKGGFLHNAKRSFAAALCLLLAVAVAVMAVAVLLQALAVLIVAALAAALLLPHSPKWYAKEGAEAVRMFVQDVFGRYV